MSKKENMTEALLNSLVAQPAPAADPVPEKMTKAAKTTSVYLSAQQHAKIEEIARSLETNKHSVLQLAIRKFIEDWNNGYRPEARYKKVY